MSGSSMDGLDIAYCVIEEIRGRWTYTIEHSACIPFPVHWKNTLEHITSLPARELMRAHTAFGAWMGAEINQFITKHQLEHKVHLVASHGHTVFHEPQNKLSFQLGDGAAISVALQLPVVSDLRNMDVALGGQGAPIVPLAEQLLWPETSCFLNLGGIANISIHQNDRVLGFDVCPANRILNELAAEAGLPFDNDGNLAASGACLPEVLASLNALDYYNIPAPKSLPNEMGLHQLLPLLQNTEYALNDRLRTAVEHISDQIHTVLVNNNMANAEVMVSGGGALNGFLLKRLNEKSESIHINYTVPNMETVQYKEALAMALLGVLRWREEETVLVSVTGAQRATVGGALWMGQV